MDAEPRTSTEPVVALDDAVAVIGRFPALAGATLRVAAGEIVLLQGPNGAGKTSLLRLCAGLLPLARGSGRVFGLDLATQREAIRPRVALLGHRNGLYRDLTVAENVGFWGATVAATDDEVEAAMERLGVGGRLRDVPVSKLSAGQKRRTALACLVARRAELWLLDEPHAGLDAAGRDELDAVLRQAVGAGATVIVASHELERAGRPRTTGSSRSSPARSSRMQPVNRWRIARLVAAKDLRIERPQPGRRQPGAAVRGRDDGDVRLRPRRRVGGHRCVRQPHHRRARAGRTGLVWLATLFSLLVLVQRSFAIEIRRRRARRPARGRRRSGRHLLGQVDGAWRSNWRCSR